jgi:hypothetical protein
MMIAAPARKPLGPLKFAAIVLSLFSLGLTVLSEEAPHIRNWFAAREEALAQSFTDTRVNEAVLAWAKEKGLHVEVRTGLAMSTATVLFGVGTPDATCDIRLARQGAEGYLHVTKQNTEGSQRAACQQALTTLAQQVSG